MWRTFYRPRVIPIWNTVLRIQTMKSMSEMEKAKLVAWREVGKSVKDMMKLSGRSRRTVQRFFAALKLVPEGELPQRKKGQGRKRKITPQVINAIKRSITSMPMMSARELKARHFRLLANISVRTIRTCLIRDLGLKAYVPAKKPMLTEQMIQKRLRFCREYGGWTEEQWMKVMFSDESTMRLVRGAAGWIKVRRKMGTMERYKQKHCIATVKKPGSVMVWGAFSGAVGRGGLFFLEEGVTMRAVNYLEVLKDHLLLFYRTHGCKFFLQDGAPCHKAKVVGRWLEEEGVDLINWPGNSPDLNPIENLWSIMKGRMQREPPKNRKELVERLTRMWVT